MIDISVGETMSAIIDQDYQLYTWGVHSSKENPMPQLVAELA